MHELSRISHFRSVLPHEPLPDEEYGYVNIQGSFSPKLVTPHATLSPTETQVNLSSISSSTQSIQKMLFNALTANKDYLPKDSPLLNLTVEQKQVVDVQILDANRTLSGNDLTHQTFITKSRITYACPRIARQIVSFLKDHQISPFDLCIVNPSSTFIYSRKAIQVTQVTQVPLPEASIAWPRSGMPKFRRLLATEYDKQNPEALLKLQAQREKTRFVFLSNIMIECAICPSEFDFQDSIRNALHPFCDFKDLKDLKYGENLPVEVFLPSKKQNLYYKFCHIGARSPIHAQRLVTELQGKSLSLKFPDGVSILTCPLFLDYADVTERCAAKSSRLVGNKSDCVHESCESKLPCEPPKPECTSLTTHLKVPGLICLHEFISKEEEQVILAVLIGPHAPWAPAQQNFSKTGIVKRRVQHYGYVFDYETADVLRDRSESYEKNAKCPYLPSLPIGYHSWNMEKVEKFIHEAVNLGNGWDVIAGILERVRRYNFGVSFDESASSEHNFPFQSTNKSPSGINNKNEILKNLNHPSHTELKFPYINQVTVNEYKRGQGIGSHVDTVSAFGDGIFSLSLGSSCVMEFYQPTTTEKKLVSLPPRSLLLMSGDARYVWEHMIVTRSTDCIDGTVIPRQTRISLTLRTAISLPDENGNIKPLKLLESNVFPPRWDQMDLNKDQTHELVTPDTERCHVHAVYDAIATQWHHTRGKRGVLWFGITKFLLSLPKGSVVCDVGCGDGKYFPAIWNTGSYVIGTDISEPLLRTSVGACLEDGSEDTGPQMRQISKMNSGLNKRPAVIVADCMYVPIRSRSCDAALCIAVMHHLSTVARRIRCLKELARIVKVGGTIIIQAWSLEQDDNSRRKFAGNDVFVPFNAQPRYLNKVQLDRDGFATEKVKSAAEVYSEAYEGAEYDETKGLVVFQRYCHMFREGELESLVAQVEELEVLESTFESGNWQVILKVKM